jgi:serralysin
MNYRRYGFILTFLVAVFSYGTSWAICEYGPDTCVAGYVWREAFPGDHVCVLEATRTQAANDNKLASQRRSPTGGPYGPDTCRPGFVWREASPQDHVCVTGATRAQTSNDNNQAGARRDPRCASIKPNPSGTRLEQQDKSVAVKVPIKSIPNIAGIHFEMEKRVAGTLPPKPSTSRTKISSDGSVIGISQAPLAGIPDRMWNPGQTLRVRMTGGSALVRSKVRQFAEEWTKYANIRFAFVDDSQPAEIKIDFGSDGFSWSVIGRNALLIPFNFSTMHFGWLTDNTPNAEFRGVVLHEFGHALGLIHEHLSPVAGIQWDKEKVYAFFNSVTPPWNRGMVDSEVFAVYSASSTNFSQFDPTSIMEYAFPASLTLNGVGIPGNTNLSAIDKQYIARWYPYPGADVGRLRTNDDCDQIDFRVEYGVEAKDKVHFLLRPGNTVTWWKSIQVPIGANQYAELQIQDGGSTDRVIDKVSLDSSRPIRFSKAKGLGVHTLLGYRWDVISALPGGSRVTLDWVNDHCR